MLHRGDQPRSFLSSLSFWSSYDGHGKKQIRIHEGGNFSHAVQDQCFYYATSKSRMACMQASYSFAST
ncbi:hypothetical protein PsorP6_001542 [Peronosclerospora sorghi]|uniref:Uncharacterized protein n=1 Tax=Peronosclerospora sorghi TaxID=230839 RepID=A0ACC0WVS6_9STRA|nr:hypothetical protein PsorP6_001542 [Peronosclerospora sorghi]